MDCHSQRIPYRQTNHFSKIVLDYIDHSDQLKQFYSYPPTLKGIQAAIEERKTHGYEREVLVQELSKQYEGLHTTKAVKDNIQTLLSEDTFTICTAHQPNIFTGPLYFIYKIIHTIKLSDHLNSTLPAFTFVPVYFMGSEDADLEELGHIYIDGEKKKWTTGQTGAVGRMKVDKKLTELIDSMEGQLKVFPFGQDIIALARECYKEGTMIQEATLKLLNHLFGQYGLVVLIADCAALKKQMIDVFRDDLQSQVPSSIVETTCENLGANYKVQAHPREINLFYLKDDKRVRIIKKNGKYSTHDHAHSFTDSEMLSELNDHPERFSPNVILRGLYQEKILPNVAFIGGGGELAYWLQLKELFNHYRVPFPALVLRNSFLLIEKKWQDRLAKLELDVEELFLPEQELLDRFVLKETSNTIKLNGSLTETEELYNSLKKLALTIDVTLGPHVEALKSTAIKRLQELEKKMLRAEKRKFTDQQRQVLQVKEKLFPSGGLQERYENMFVYYSKWGTGFLENLKEHSLVLEHEFTIISER